MGVLLLGGFVRSAPDLARPVRLRNRPATSPPKAAVGTRRA